MGEDGDAHVLRGQIADDLSDVTSLVGTCDAFPDDQPPISNCGRDGFRTKPAPSDVIGDGRDDPGRISERRFRKHDRVLCSSSRAGLVNAFNPHTVGSKESVDALVWVAEQDQPAVSGDQLQEVLLSIARVLELVNDHEAPSRAKVLGYRWRGLGDLNRKRDEPIVSNLVLR